jgi:hypothetical protein
VISRKKTADGKHRELRVFLAAIGPYLLFVSMIFNFMAIAAFSKYEWIAFNVVGGLSYSFDRLSPIFSSSNTWAIQVLAFVSIQLSLLWANRSKLESLFASL